MLTDTSSTNTDVVIESQMQPVTFEPVHFNSQPWPALPFSRHEEACASGISFADTVRGCAAGYFPSIFSCASVSLYTPLETKVWRALASFHSALIQWYASALHAVLIHQHYQD